MKYLEAKRGRGAPENKALGGAPENKATDGADGAGPLEGVAFASPSAKTKAEEAGLTAESFKGRRKASDRGFTLADVERIAAATADDEEKGGEGA